MNHGSKLRSFASVLVISFERFVDVTSIYISRLRMFVHIVTNAIKEMESKKIFMPPIKYCKENSILDISNETTSCQRYFYLVYLNNKIYFYYK